MTDKQKENAYFYLTVYLDARKEAFGRYSAFPTAVPETRPSCDDIFEAMKAAGIRDGLKAREQSYNPSRKIY